MMTVPNAEGKGWMSIALAGVVAATGGAIASVANPEGVSVLITRSILYVATPSTGVANVNVGVGATATTDATDMINALAINGAITGKYYNASTIQGTTKTEVSAPAVWTATTFVNVTGSADSSGFVGTLYIEYLRV
jgi:hypothetical protein